MNTAIVQRSDNMIEPQTVYPLLDKLNSLGCNVYIPSQLTEFYSGYEGKLLCAGDSLSRENTDMIFVLGGDGSIISAARKNYSLGVPIVGVNFGKIAYMAELEITELDLVEKIISGESRIEERIMLDVCVVRNGEIICTKYPALNDAVLSNGPISKIISFELYCNGVAAQSIRSDGIVISTPTGSTAYSMSAGGPVLDPCLKCITATPICPHAFGQRPVVFDSHSIIELRNMNCRRNNMYLSVDGSEIIPLESGDTVRISRSEYKTRLARIKNSTFLKVLHEKMGEKN